MPTAYISTPPGRHMPTIPAIEPALPRKRSPTRMAIFVEFKPGSDWLMASSSTNPLSSSQPRLVTKPFLRYATTPPPKLVAPIIKNSTKICRTEGGVIAAAMAGTCTAGVADTSLMALRLISLQPVHHSCLGAPQSDPTLRRLLQRQEIHLGALLGVFMNVFPPVEFRLKRELADQRLVLAARPP